jgi:hypothetical protein
MLEAALKWEAFQEGFRHTRIVTADGAGIAGDVLDDFLDKHAAAGARRLQCYFHLCVYELSSKLGSNRDTEFVVKTVSSALGQVWLQS